jgi:hypothetical protein
LPFCSGRYASHANSLATLFPEIAVQWHPTKNGDVTPGQVPPGSAKKYWWKCDESSDHEWDAQVNARVGRGYGCPFCAGNRVSKTSIHTPPPNQIIHVNSAQPLKSELATDAVWVSGVIETLRSDTGMGSAGYRMNAESIEPYRNP